MFDSWPILFKPNAQGIIANNAAEKKAAFRLTNFFIKKYKAITDKTPARADENLMENSLRPNSEIGIIDE